MALGCFHWLPGKIQLLPWSSNSVHILQGGRTLVSWMQYRNICLQLRHILSEHPRRISPEESDLTLGMAGCLLIHPLLLRVSLCLAGVGTGFTENPESRLLSDLDYCGGVLFLCFPAYVLMLVPLSPGQPLPSRKSGRAVEDVLGRAVCLERGEKIMVNKNNGPEE